MATKYVQARRSVLESSINNSTTTCTITGFLDLSGNPITQTDIGTIGYGTLEPNTDSEEAISFTIDSNTAGVAVLTITRGLLGKAPYGTGGTAYSHNAGSELVISNNPSLLNKMTAKDNDEVVSGSWEFPTPTADASPATKKYVDENVVGGEVSINRTVEAGTAGATLVAGDLVYFDTADVEWKKTAGATATTVNNVKLGIAQGAGVDGGAIAGGVLTYGLDSTQTGMTPGALQYAGDISGSIVETAGTIERIIGQSKSATELYFDANFSTLPSSAEKAFLTSLAGNNVAVFGGDGSDGILNVTSGTTTLDLSVKTDWNYESITIAAAATLTFSGGTGGDLIPILRCRGDFLNEGTITTVGLAGNTAAGGLKASVGSGAGTAGDGADGDLVTVKYVDGTLPGGGLLGTGAARTVPGSAADVAGVGGAAPTKDSLYFAPYGINGTGGGGGGGGVSANVGTPGDGGDGGRGSLGLVIEVAGDFDNQGTIDLSGEAGEAGENAPGNGSDSWTSGAGGGGGGGAAGSLLAYYAGELLNFGTITADGGAGGANGVGTNTGASGGSPVDGYGGGGGSGGANSFNDGMAGGDAPGDRETGGSGGSGAAGMFYLAKHYS